MTTSILVLDQTSNDIVRMLEKLKKRMSDLGAPSNPSPPVPPTQGHDAKALAELKADTAGEKWRVEAEARGEKPIEIGGPKGLEPTRYGDWERAGRCVDF